jgi:homoserine O-acetyltransferase/O-succinyltransferase
VKWQRSGRESEPEGADLMTLAGSAPLADQKRLPTRDAANKDVEEGESRFAWTHDANDVLYAVAASHDFINPPELGIAEREIKRVKHGRFILIPASESTHGHGTHTWGVFWQKELKELLAATAKK